MKRVTEMKWIYGIGASEGIAIGQIMLYHGNSVEITEVPIMDAEKELIRLDEARENSIRELNGIYQQSLQRIGEKDSLIFQIHIMMLEDEDFFGAIQKMIREQKVNAEYAVWKVGQQLAAKFARMDDEYMHSRKNDIIDISTRLIRCLNKKTPSWSGEANQPFIIASIDLMPSETIQIDKSNVWAILTRDGSRTSHSAILARSLGIPSVVNLGEGFGELQEGMLALVNGSTGEVLLEPDDVLVREYEKKREEFAQYRQSLCQLIGKKAVTKGGVQIEVNANIGHPGEAETALKNDADGIGLFRSEFLYMERDSVPTEEIQFQAYKDVLEKMKGKRVIIRTLDLGADKSVPYLDLPKEINPALGYRAIRICLDRKELFYTQLRALLRASVHGKLSMMFPMIVSIDEVKTAQNMIEQVKTDLKREKLPFAPDIEVGIMIETPAAVMISDELAKEVDFFSIGTNDLTQYTLAVDRMNGIVAGLYDPSHTAVLRMIEMAVKNAKRAGIWVGICGESAADKKLTKLYLDMGIDELSVTPSAVLELKKVIREM